MTPQITIETPDWIRPEWNSPEKLVRITIPGVDARPLINRILTEKPEGVGYVNDGEDDGWVNFDLMGEILFPCGLTNDAAGNAIISFVIWPSKEGDDALDGTTQANELSLDDILSVAFVSKKVIGLLQ
jgi:hypothetical protein